MIIKIYNDSDTCLHGSYLFQYLSYFFKQVKDKDTPQWDKDTEFIFFSLFVIDAGNKSRLHISEPFLDRKHRLNHLTGS